jgi:glycosyltransferase involved in cell wall biosynthesis
LEVLYSAAHAEFPDTEPLGGGKAVADHLIREWNKQKPFPLTVLSPARFGLDGEPRSVVAEIGRTRRSASLHEMSEHQYARFCRQFERATTAEILRRDPQQCVVLTNDISEGPDFAALGERSYRLVSLWHVDVVEFFTKFYLQSLVRPEMLTKFRRFALLPDVLRLVFEKQYDCVRYSARIVVPSPPMKDVILRCYPDCPAEKIVVLPWGNIRVGPASSLAVVLDRKQDACATEDDFVIMTLSRLSPEKGIERLLRALPLVNGRCRVWICGAPAYMKGRRYERKLRRLADRRVEFLGHVTGERKATLLRRADLFVSPSRHESYGLTIAEAAAAGCRIISHAHYGASGMVVDCGNRKALARTLDEAIAAGRTVKSVATPAPSDAAAQLARLVERVSASKD